MRSARLVLLFAVVCLSSNAFADDHLADAAKAHFEQGQTLTAAGQFAEARAEFLAGFELSHKPAFLFNAAECSRLMGKNDVAREGYDQYLKLDPNGKLAMLALQRLDELGPKQTPVETTPPPAPVLTPEQTGVPAPTLGPISSAAAPATTTTLTVHRSIPDTSNTAQIERYAGIGTAGLGVAMIVTAAVFGYKSSTLSNQVSGACTNGCVWSDVSYIDAYARTDATVQWWLYGLGAAAVVAGGTMYFLGSQEHSPVVVAPSANGASVSWSGHF
jgi:tetratricopeptide (TPR) repeat protein